MIRIFVEVQTIVGMPQLPFSGGINSNHYLNVVEYFYTGGY